jgi:hypothetical protein
MMNPKDRQEPICRNDKEFGNFDEIRIFNRRGLFVGGCPKSGTTLLLSLLDGHPKLVVLPEETHFLDKRPHYLALDSYQAKSRGLLEESGLRLLAQGRFARFGRSGEAPSADLRDYGGFDHQRFTRLAAYSAEQPWINDSLLFSETVRAYAITIGCNWRDCVRWVEKSTSNEACSDALFGLFPEAKLLQVVRDPRAVFASRKKRLLNISGCYSKAHRLLRGWNQSSRQILKLMERRDQYLVLRYEDLIQDPRESLEGVCRFIGIEFLPELLSPTRAGRQWEGNSSFHSAFNGISAQPVDYWKSELTADEIWWVEMHCRQGMLIADYSLRTEGRFSFSRWLKRLPGESWGGYLRARRGSLCQLAGLLEDCRYAAVPAELQAGMLCRAISRVSSRAAASPPRDPSPCA